MRQPRAVPAVAHAPVTGADDVETIAALGAAVNDTATFDPWAGAFLAMPDAVQHTRSRGAR